MDSEVVPGQGACDREDALTGGSPDDAIGAARVGIDRYGACAIRQGGGVDDLPEYDSLGIAYVGVQGS